MRNITAALVLFYTLTSCNNNMQHAISQIQSYGRQQQIEDATLQQLQQQNELVLVYGIEKYAWAKQKKYHVLALNNGQWKGFDYNINFGPGAQQRVQESNNLSPVTISQDSCKAIWKFFSDKKAWEIPGDSGINFCDGEKARSCNINDGATWRLMILTKDRTIDPSYYEPKYFENCCPGNKYRKLFLEAGEKIDNLFGEDSDMNGNPTN